MADPRASVDDERAPLLQLNAPADEESASQNRGEDEERDFDRRSIIDVLKQPRLLTTFEQGLVILAIVLLCLSAILGGLAIGSWDRARHERDKGRNSPPRPTSTQIATTTQIVTTTVGAGVPAPTGAPKEPPSRNDEICLTPTCVQISAAILDSIDPSVDPCDDFYQFANGGWLATHPIPPAKGLFGAAQWIDQRNKDLLLRILETPVEDVMSSLSASEENDAMKEADRQNLKDLNSFFGMCMDEDALDRRGSEPLLSIVREVVSAFRGTADFKHRKESNKRQRLTDTLLLLHSKGIDALFETSAEGDYRDDPEMLRLWLSQSGLGLPNPDYYSDSAVEKVYIEVVRSAVSDIYKQLGESHMAADSHKKNKKKKKKGDKKDPAFDYSKIFELEQSLASVYADSTDLEDPVLAYNAYDLSALHELAPFLIWTDYFSGFAPRQIPSPAIVTAPGYFGNLTNILDKADDETLEAYFVWKTVQSLGNLLGPRERARKEVTQLQNYLSGIDSGVRPSRQDVCLQSLLDNYGFMVGRYFVTLAFSGDSKAYAETVIRSTIQAFKDRLPELDWLDASSRKAAEEKASAIGVKIGWATSPNVTDPIALKAHYAAVRPEKGRFFETVLASRTMDERRKWFSLSKKRDPGTWEMIPTEVNAYYQPQANEMVFPAGVLQAPYFSKDYPEYLGFGSMASLAGHELTHAFDSAGRQFDKTGKLTDWWSNDTIARYSKLTECIVDQYAEYYVIGPDGKHYNINSKFTLGEDIADGGGLAQTFRAWQDRFHSDKKGEKFDNYVLPGLNYTREQLFFMQFARGWARNIKPAEAVRRIRVDEHSPTKFRVIGPLSNSEEFNKAFNCPKKSRMNRKHKCHIW